MNGEFDIKKFKVLNKTRCITEGIKEEIKENRQKAKDRKD